MMRSLIFFLILYLTNVHLDSKIETAGNIFFKPVRALVYAEDLDLVGRSLPAMESVYYALEKSSEDAAFQVN